MKKALIILLPVIVSGVAGAALILPEPTLRSFAGPFDEFAVEQQRAAKGKLWHLLDVATGRARQVVVISDAVLKQLARPAPSEIDPPVQQQPMLKEPLATAAEPAGAVEDPPAEPMPAAMPEKHLPAAEPMAAAIPKEHLADAEPMAATMPKVIHEPKPKPKKMRAVPAPPPPPPLVVEKPLPSPKAPPLAETAEAAHHQALLYYKGDGVGKDFRKAAEWFQKAAAKGFPKSQYMLGVMAYQGLGEPQDFAEAAKWFRKAGEQQHTGAQYNLGFLYYEGKGVKKDDLQAYMWIDRAANLGHEKSIQARTTLKKILPKEIYQR